MSGDTDCPVPSIQKDMKKAKSLAGRPASFFARSDNEMSVKNATPKLGSCWRNTLRKASLLIFPVDVLSTITWTVAASLQTRDAKAKVLWKSPFSKTPVTKGLSSMSFWLKRFTPQKTIGASLNNPFYLASAKR